MSDDAALFERLRRPPPAPDAAPADEMDLFARLLEAARPPPAPALEAPPGTAPVGRMGSFMQGMGDIPRGIEQLSARIRGSEPAFFTRMRQDPRYAGMMSQTPMEGSAEVDARLREREATYEAGRVAAGRTGTDWWRMGGQAAATLPLAAATAPASLPGAVAAGAATGALAGAAQPVTEGESYWGEKATQTLASGAAGAVGGAAGNVLGRLISPRPPEGARLLREAGVELTPGQAAGGLGRRIEDKALSLPIVGDAIAGAQRRSIESFNRATANRVLEPLGQRLPDDVPVGRELVAAVDDRIGAAYREAISRTQPFGPDVQFAQDIASVAQGFLTPESRQTFGRIVQDRVVSRFGGGPIDGATFKTIDSELGQAARTYSASNEPANREIARSLRGVQQALRGLLARANPTVAPDIQAADQAFAQFVRLEGAAGAQGATEGVFSPQQLSAAVRAGDRTTRRGSYARGDALMEDLSDAGRAILPNSVPNSGTTDRLLNAAMLGGAATGQLPMAALAAGPAAGLLYSRPMTNAMAGLLLAQRPAPVGLLGDAIAGSGGAVAVPLGAMLLSPPERRAQ